MKQRMYLKAATAISPQHTFGDATFLSPVESTHTGKLQIIAPDYTPYINPVAIRRMSRIMKMAISAAMQCLSEAGVSIPDAIITGTGRGSMTDMEVFMKDMIRLEEGAMNPTIFIQSTYNSPNGWIAQLSKSTSYNQTYVHRGCSLELAFLDAQLIFAETTEVQNVLAGCYDEVTEDYVIIKEKIDYWKQPRPHSLQLHQYSNTPGTIAGEGAAFFTLSNEQGGAHAAIEDIQLIQDASSGGIATAVGELLDRQGIHAEAIDLILTGKNGDCRHDAFYADTLAQLSAPIAVFKHLSGEYDTASGFGIWVANWLLKQESVPELFLLAPGQIAGPKTLLFINHYITGSAVVMLLCKL